MHSGAAIYSYELKVPPGTNDLQPKLALTYNSHNALSLPDIAGDGWTLSQSYIQRDVNGTRDDSADDKFTVFLEGASYELVYNPTDGKYHTKVETFLDIQNLSTTTNDKGMYWLVREKDGTSYKFGYNKSSENVGNKNTFVWRWYVDVVQDTHGNAIFYNYKENPHSNDKGVTYIDNITYNNDGQRVIKFVYESSDRPDIWPNVFNNGNELKYARRLQEIQVIANGTLVRKYGFSYSSTFTGINNARSFLTAITEYGSDGSSLSPYKFGYYYASGNPVISNGFLKTPECGENPQAYSGCFVDTNGNDNGVRAIDVNNDGLVDIIRGKEGQNSRTWINNGSEWIQNNTWLLHGCDSSPYSQCFITQSGGDNAIRFGDVNGDGLVDILRSKAGDGSNVWINTGHGWTDFGTWAVPNCDFNSAYEGCFVLNDGTDSGYQVIDVNADGRVDLVRSREGATVKTWMNTGKGWREDSAWKAPACEGTSAGCFVKQNGQDYGGRFVDVNRDGLPDAIVSRPNEIRTYINTGKGWESFDTWVPPECSGSQDEGCFVNNGVDVGVRLGDINGDSLVDIVKAYDGSGYARTWQNNGHGWTDYLNWKIPNCVSGGSQDNCFIDNGIPNGVYFVDFSGDGVPDLIKTHLEFGNSYGKAYINPSERVGLLRNITTSFGAVILINYTELARYENKGKSDIPEVGIPLWLISSLREDNGVSSSQNVVINTTYFYRGGYFHYNESDYRGFSFVSENKSNNITMYHYFHQDNGRKGQEYKTEILDKHGSLFQRQDSTWTTLLNNTFYLTLRTDENTSTFDGSSSNPKISKINYEYDAYSNVKSKDSLGDISILGDERYEDYEYVYGSPWIVDKIKQYQLFDSDGTTKLKEVKYSYDGQSFGSAPTKGDVTKEEKTIVGGTTATTLYGYDGYGNAINQTDANDHTTKFIFGLRDATYTYPDQVINAKNHATDYRFDFGTGNVKSTVDPNGFITNYTYDVFGRLSKEIKPLDTLAHPTKEIVYTFDGAAPEQITIKQREINATSDTLDSYQFHDGFGKIIQRKSEAEDDKQIVENVFYEDNKRMRAQSNKYLISSSADYSAPNLLIKQTNYTYDPLDRVIKVNNPDNTSRSANYDHWMETQFDENNNKKVITKDAYGRIAKVDEYNPSIATTTYNYSAADTILKITDSQGNNIAFFYDMLQRKTSINDPDLGMWNYTYDGVGNLLTQKDPLGITITFTYDALDRVTQKTANGQTFSYIYDNPTLGTLSSMGGPDLIRNYTYDSRLRTTTDQKTINGTAFMLRFSYDSLNRITTTQAEAIDTITQTYSNQGLLDTVSGITTATTHNEANAVNKRVYDNSLITNFSYHPDNLRLTRIQTADKQNMSYSYDNVSNVVSIDDAIHSRTLTMTYDALSRLLSALRTDNGNMVFDFTYAYNSIGNMLNASSSNETLLFTYDKSILAHAPVSVQYLVGKPLDVHSLSVLNATNLLRIFEFVVQNNRNTTLAMDWTFQTGVESINSTISTTLTADEDVFVIFEYNYTTSGTYNVTASAKAGSLSDSESIIITV